VRGNNREECIILLFSFALSPFSWEKSDFFLVHYSGRQAITPDTFKMYFHGSVGSGGNAAELTGAKRAYFREFNPNNVISTIASNLLMNIKSSSRTDLSE
jgi:hypothetical protein